MKRHILVGILLTLFSTMHAQKPIVMPLWENESEATLYIYAARQPNGMAIICCPGGGYSHLAMEHEGTDMANWFNTQGITLAVLKYRMPNGHKHIPLTDACQAMQIIHQHTEDWHIDSKKIGIMGASAGGHLAASLANLATQELRPAFQILLYPVITMTDADTHKGSQKSLLGESPSAEDIKHYSLEQQVNPLTPPAFIALSSDDKAVPPTNSLNYAIELGKAGIPYTLHVYPTGGHGWGFRDSFTYKRQWTDELEKWLREIKL